MIGERPARRPRRTPSIVIPALAALVFLAVPSATVARVGTADEEEIVVFHANDIHGYITERPGTDGRTCDGMALMAGALEEGRRAAARRGARSVFLFAGDMFQGTPVVDLTRGACMIDLLNRMRLTAASLGNHEFDYGPQVLEEGLARARFGVLATNVRTRRPAARWLTDGVVLPLGAVRLGLVGVTTPHTKRLSFAGNVDGFEFSPPEEALPPVIARLRGQGADAIIAVTHSGVDEDRGMALRVHGIDLVVGGHTHTALETPITQGSTVIVQAGDYGRYLGEVRMAVRPGGGGVRVAGARLIRLCRDAIAPHPGLAEAVARHMAPIRDIVARPVGQLSVDLPRGLKGDHSPVAALVAAAMQEASSASIAIVNTGGVRRPLWRGTVRVGDLHEMAPFGNTLVTMQLDGASIRRLLERSASGEWVPYGPLDMHDMADRIPGMTVRHGLRPGRRPAGFVLCAGLTYAFDPRRPEGSRVVDVRVGTGPLEDTRTYAIACSNYLAAGGDGMLELTKGKGVRFHADRDRDIIARYLERHSPVSSPPPRAVVNLANEVAPAEAVR